jgi:glyoxylase-like metal-dependent hydrolase (beta-lactamase superfamily II)
MPAMLQHAVTSGTFSLDGGTWEVDNNVWVLGDDEECVVIDAPHDATAIAELIGTRRLIAVLCTHAHDDHVSAAEQLSIRYGAPVRLHIGDDVLWRQSYPDFDFVPIAGGDRVSVAGTALEVLVTPGHSPGAVCYYWPDGGAVFSGDTLFQGGPGATGRSYSDFPTIIASIDTALLTLPEDTVVHTGHGADTTIGAERDDRDEWLARGH